LFFRSLELHKQPLQPLFSNTSTLIIICREEIGTKKLACIEDAGTGTFIFKPVLGRVVFSLTFPWTGWFRNYMFWDGLQFFSLSIQGLGFWTWTGKNFLKNQP
jgi:hypothetical protein